MRTNLVRAALAAAFLIVTAGVASAHVSISSGPAQATKSQKITLSVGHGCDGADTISVRVVLPAGVSSVRALPSETFKPAIEGTAAAVTAVTWTKPVEDVLDSDYGYYELTLRARVGDVPFTRLYFRVYQTCRAMDGTVSTHDWAALPGEEGDPAPSLTVVPARVSGWNKFTLSATVAAADLPTYFGEAQIVWRGAEAYSPNANTMTLIGATPGVSVLNSDLTASQEIWVKY
ncbi:MAG: YcnI family protein [Kofleriaceae bacterium]|nr:MAG: YcnI family protein [Kofleriaceae bacterium]MBZ0235197.1 YcnI family protein [Kofleriaceae bacterium]